MDQDTDKIIDGLKDKAPETYQVMMELRRERQEREAKQEKKRRQNVIILLPSIWILIYLLLWYVFDQSGIADRWWLACWTSLAITLPCWALIKRDLADK